MRRLFGLLSIALLLCVHTLSAQQNEIMFAVKVGHNTLFSSFTAFSFDAKYSVGNNFSLRGGAQYNSYSRMAVELRPAYYRDIDRGRLSAEVLLGYVGQNNIGNLTLGGGATLDMHSMWATLGYYHRTMMRSGDRLTEPFNLYYEFGLRCLPNKEQWDVNAIISNSRIFELERHYQPSYIVEGWWYPKSAMGVMLSIDYKPAGVFNMASDYYQLYTKLGVCYRW